jgi:hypothetical protein
MVYHPHALGVRDIDGRSEKDHRSLQVKATGCSRPWLRFGSMTTLCVLAAGVAETSADWLYIYRLI